MIELVDVRELEASKELFVVTGHDLEKLTHAGYLVVYEGYHEDDASRITCERLHLCGDCRRFLCGVHNGEECGCICTRTNLYTTRDGFCAWWEDAK